jgi:hypothetical protein
MKRSVFALCAGAAAISAAPAFAQNVKVTPLGSHEGEFCRNDRARREDGRCNASHEPLSAEPQSST